MLKTSIFFLVALVAFVDQAHSLSCKDEKGENLDWYVLLKAPKQKKHADPKMATGGAYGFITSKSDSPGWQLGEKDISDEGSFTGKTFAEVFKNPEKYSYVQYNDAKPEGLGTDSSTYAHAKGALVWNKNEAVWLMHSTPKFLPVFASKKYEFPKSGKIHGQNFLCITLDPKESVNKVLNHLVTMKAQVYASIISKDAFMNEDIQENINILAKKVKSNKGEPKEELDKMDENRINELTTTLKSKGGETFTLISKSRNDKVDIWSQIAAPAIKAKEFAVKFWVLLQKATSLLSSTCSKEKIFNVLNMDVQLGNEKVKWGKNDHSKWGLCTDGGNDCYCAGDMNRAKSQFDRGGGVVCLHSKNVHDTFMKSFSTQYDCSNTLQKNPKKMTENSI